MNKLYQRLFSTNVHTNTNLNNKIAKASVLTQAPYTVLYHENLIIRKSNTQIGRKQSAIQLLIDQSKTKNKNTVATSSNLKQEQQILHSSSGINQRTVQQSNQICQANSKPKLTYFQDSLILNSQSRLVLRYLQLALGLRSKLKTVAIDNEPIHQTMDISSERVSTKSNESVTNILSYQ